MGTNQGKGEIEVKNSFGTNLSALRNHAGLSQSALAEQLGVSRQAVSSWERDLSEPDIGSLDRIAEALDVPVSDLIDGPTGEKAVADVKINPIFTIVSTLLAAAHVTLGICGLVNIFAAVCLPVTCAFITATIYAAFTMMFKSGHYDMLAGFDPKKDSVKKTQMQMCWIAILTGLSSILFEVLFTLVYFTQREKQMNVTTIMLLSYCAAILISCVAVNQKVKSRNR